MRSFLFLTALVVQEFSLLAKENSGSMRALIVYDKASSELGASYGADARRMEKSLRNIAKCAHIKLTLQVQKANGLSPKALDKWIQSIPPASCDTAFLYYSGKGAYVPGTNSPWPAIAYPHFTRTLKLADSEESIAARIQRRNPRLTCVLFDCYDKLIDSTPKEFSIPKLFPKKGASVGLRKLFLQSQGVVTVCSRPHERDAYAIRQKRPEGGFFSMVFLKFLAARRATSNEWSSLMADIGRYCSLKDPFKQIPIIMTQATKSTESQSRNNS